MSETGAGAVARYLTAVDGWSTLLPCVQHPFSNAFYFYPGVICESVTVAAALFCSCVCENDGEAVQRTMLSDVYTNSHCTGGQTSSALSAYSALCSSAVALAAVLTGDSAPTPSKSI